MVQHPRDDGGDNKDFSYLNMEGNDMTEQDGIMRSTTTIAPWRQRIGQWSRRSMPMAWFFINIVLTLYSFFLFWIVIIADSRTTDEQQQKQRSSDSKLIQMAQKSFLPYDFLTTLVWFIESFLDFPYFRPPQDLLPPDDDDDDDDNNDQITTTNRQCFGIVYNPRQIKHWASIWVGPIFELALTVIFTVWTFQEFMEWNYGEDVDILSIEVIINLIAYLAQTLWLVQMMDPLTPHLSRGLKSIHVRILCRSVD